MNYLTGMVITVVLIALCQPLVFKKLAIAATRQPGKFSNPGTRMTYTRVYRVFSTGMFCLGFLFCLLTASGYNIASMQYWVGINVVLTLLAVYMLIAMLDSFTTSISYNDETIEVSNFLGTRRIQWDEVTICDHGVSTDSYVIKSNREKIKVSIYLKGIAEFRQFLTNRLSAVKMNGISIR